jgi:hypothetical protein
MYTFSVDAVTSWLNKKRGKAMSAVNIIEVDTLFWTDKFLWASSPTNAFRWCLCKTQYE